MKLLIAGNKNVIDRQPVVADEDQIRTVQNMSSKTGHQSCSSLSEVATAQGTA